jgi:hypothetical protein
MQQADDDDGDDPAGDDPAGPGELERTAEWRLRLVDADPADTASAAAAALLTRLAAELRALRDHPLRTEYTALCSWLGESDAISEFALRADEYRRRIGIDRWPESGEAYLRTMLDLARQTL